MLGELFEIEKIELDSFKFIGPMADVTTPQKLSVIKMWDGWKEKSNQDKHGQSASFYLDGKVYSTDVLQNGEICSKSTEEKQPEKAETESEKVCQPPVKLNPMLMQIIYDVYPLIRCGKLEDGIAKQLIVQDKQPNRGIYKKNGRFYWREPNSREYEFVSAAAARLFCLAGHEDPSKGNALETLDRQEVLIPQLKGLKQAMASTRFAGALQFLVQQLGIESSPAPEARQTGLSDILAGG